MGSLDRCTMPARVRCPITAEVEASTHFGGNVNQPNPVPTENLVWPITAPRRARVTCYTAPLHLVDFKCASSFGEAHPTKAQFTFSANIFRRSTNQPAVPNRRACAKQKEIFFMSGTTNWRTTRV